VHIADPSVPPPPPPAPAGYTRRTWAVLGLVLGAVVLATAAAGWFYKVPYFALLPGSARDTDGLIQIEGANEYPSDGQILYTTVRVRGRLSLWEYLWLLQRNDVDVVPEATVLGDRDRGQNRQYNLQLMDNSKQVAVAVALDELGFAVTESTGVLIVTVVEGSAADGLLDPGDVVVAVDGVPVLEAPQLVERLGGRRPGDEVELVVERHTSGEVATVAVTLGENPAGSPGGFLGVGPTTRVVFGELPFEVAIDTGEVGGPSAGLAFTLALMDGLTPGELTGGERVAVTGTIAIDGTVGPVGGVPQKAVAVREAGIDVFLVPAALGDVVIDDVRSRAGTTVQVIPVEDIDDALEALSSLGGDVESLAAGATVTN
jgi:Lon-like protease